ncbi:MAG TPA: hypothetical protein VKE69_10220 [Planctomycetota bacterium]|nr:hypothetical protein [Planctomycetota bacterium]
MRLATPASILLLALVACSQDAPTIVSPPPQPRPQPTAPAQSQPAATPAAAKTGAPHLAFDTPKGWTRSTPTSATRVAELTPPRAEGDTADAQLVVFYFAGGAGTLDQNVARWAQQMTAPDGTPTPRDQVRVERMEGNGLTISWVELTGTYTPGAPMASTPPLPNARMLAAQAETAGPAYYFKFTGPDRTVAQAKDGFLAILKSARIES